MPPESTQSPAGELPPQSVEIETVRGAMTRLSLLAQALAGATEGDPEHYAEGFADQLQSALAGNVTPVTLSLRHGLMTYAGSEVSGNDLVTRQILQDLQAEGLAAVTILPGVDRQELFELSHLLVRPRSDRELMFIDAKAWSMKFRFIHIEPLAVSLEQEGEERVRPVELVRRIFSQQGVSEELLGDGMSVELMSMLGGLRGLADSPRAPRVSPPPSSSAWSRAMREIRHERDVPDEIIGLTAFESLRATSSEAERAELALLWVRQVQESMRSGSPLLAAAILRRLLICVDPDYRPHKLEAAAIRAALEEICGPETKAALVQGLLRHPQTDDWAGLLFTLGSTVSSDDLLSLADLGSELSAGPLRTALGDGLALAIERAETSPRDLLSSASDDALPVVLQAIGRFSDATLVEPLLARVKHALPSVREASLRALRSHHTPRVGVVAAEAMLDSSRAVRLEALRYLSVYRIQDAAPAIEARLRKVKEAEADGDEVRALAIALLHTSRGAALATLESIIGDPRAHSHPAIPREGIAALSAAGAPGRAALDRLGRTHKHLRALLRTPTGSAKPEASA